MKENPTRHFQDLSELELLTNFNVNLVTSVRGVANAVFQFKLTFTPGDKVRKA